MVDSDNVEIRYSLRPMTSLWRHFCLVKLGACLQHAISHTSPGYHVCECRVLAGVQKGHTVYYLVEFNLRQFNIKQLFIHKPN